jgi:CheY-like chemotaxis protein
MNMNKTILLVDDDLDYLFQLRVKVEQFGYKTVTAESQKEAEVLIETVKPDLAILDLMMEKEDSGFILCYKIKKKYPEVPIIIVSGVAAETGILFDIHDENNRRWIKADCFLEKGVRSDLLKQEIDRLIKK